MTIALIAIGGFLVGVMVAYYAFRLFVSDVFRGFFK